MKKYYFTSLLSLMVSFFAIGQQSIPVDEYERKALASNQQILDVRTAQEFNSGHLKNALQANWNNPNEFADRTRYLDKTRTVYVYCLSGGRSGAAMKQLAGKGYTVVNLDGGMMAWKKAGKPVEGLNDANKLNNKQYQALTVNSKLVLIDFGATWCPPCRKMEPIVAEIKAKYKNQLSVVAVDGGANDLLMQEVNIEALPTFILYKSGKEVWRHQGFIEQKALEQAIKFNN